MRMPNTKLLIFGNPPPALDLPLKILVWEDAERCSRVFGRIDPHSSRRLVRDFIGTLLESTGPQNRLRRSGQIRKSIVPLSSGTQHRRNIVRPFITAQ